MNLRRTLTYWFNEWRFQRFLKGIEGLMEPVPPHVCTACAAEFRGGVPCQIVGGSMVTECTKCGAHGTLVEQS